MGEFFAFVDIDAYINAKRPDGWDKKKLQDFEKYLLERGIS